MAAFVSEYFDIPGNIKQIFVPFVLDKGNSINKIPIEVHASEKGPTDTTASGGESSKTQYFSFRPAKSGEVQSDGVEYDNSNLVHAAEDSIGFLKILPASFYQDAYINTNSDIGNRLGYITSNSSVTGIDILRTMPYISVREYQQDSKLNMIMNILDSVSQVFRDASALGDATRNQSIVSVAKKVWEALKDTISTDKLLTYIQESLKKISVDDVSQLHASNDRYSDFILKFPYAIYYRLISSTSINIYELPYNGKILWESSGGGFGDGKFGGLSMGQEGIVGQLVNWFGKNITINTTPTWDGPNDQPVKVEIDFSLYNDTIDAAVKNYIFITTLLANNKWVQYHMFQHSPSLYDVKIPGVNRLFMCTAQVRVEQKGVLRNPALLANQNGNSRDAISILLSAHKNERCSLSNTDVYNADLIRIPDVYDVHITFTSLLPNNFNNFMFQFYKNDKLKVMDKLHQDSYYNVMWNTVYEQAKKNFDAKLK